MASARANEPDKDPISGFCRAAEMDFQHLSGPRNVSVDLKMIFCACVWHTHLSWEK